MSDRYAVKEVYDTVWGEGQRTGQRSVVVRLTDCNLWDGHPLHRDQGTAACARYCDADFHKGTVMDLDEVIGALERTWPEDRARYAIEAIEPTRWCVLTGGEPALQLDMQLLDALHDAGWHVHLETNGTLDTAAVRAVDYLCVSPKVGARLVVAKAHELKVVLPGVSPDDMDKAWTNEQLDALLEAGDWETRYLMPQDPLVVDNLVSVTALVPGGVTDEQAVSMAQAIYHVNVHRCLEVMDKLPGWRLSPQVAKLMGLR